VPRGEVFVYNLIILFSMALNGFVMYLLGVKLFKSRVAALGMGLIYIFCPYALTRARFHLMLTQIFIFPLLLYALLCLKRNFSTANKVKLFLVLLLALNIHPYYAFMSLLFLALLAIYYGQRVVRRGRDALSDAWPLIRTCLLVAALALLITLPVTYFQFVSSNNNGFSALTRQEGDLYTYAGHSWNYVIPSPHSFFFGSATQHFAHGKVLYPHIEEFVLFLGYTNMGLAMIILFFWFTRRWIRLSARVTEDVAKNTDWAISFALLTAVVFFIWSLPPTIKLGGITLYMPSWIVYKVVPAMRVYARFGVVVFFAVTMLSGACLACLNRALAKRGHLLRYILILLLLVLVLSEFVEGGGMPLQDIYDREPVYAEVAGLPDGSIIAEYPFAACDEAYNSIYLWNHFEHGKTMLNGYGLGTKGESLRNCVLNLLDQRTPGMLAYMGAEYVVAHKDFYKKGSDYSYQRSELDLDGLPAGYGILFEDDDSALLEITAERPETVVIYDPEFIPTISPDFGNGWWLGADKKWTIEIDSISDQEVDIHFSIFSVKGERTLRMDLGGGRTMDLLITEDVLDITIPGVRLTSGVNRIYLSSDEDPVPYKDIFGGYDFRGICFAMSLWDIQKK
jgi:hypothetical protein